VAKETAEKTARADRQGVSSMDNYVSRKEARGDRVDASGVPYRYRAGGRNHWLENDDRRRDSYRPRSRSPRGGRGSYYRERDWDPYSHSRREERYTPPDSRQGDRYEPRCDNRYDSHEGDRNRRASGSNYQSDRRDGGHDDYYSGRGR
jgi:hypothetical protein